MIVQAYEPGARTVDVIGLNGGSFTIPASYFHSTPTTTAGRHRITGYYMTGTLDR
ncbi:hypothetical protein ACWDUC_37450 [Streptomyces tricolor]